MIAKMPVIAAIDIGTNSIHVIIASVNNRGMLQVIFRDREMVRLGSGSGDMKYLEADAIDRAINTLVNFTKIAQSENAIIRAVATSAVREAINKNELLSRFEQATGIPIEIVSGTEEGRLVYNGIIHALPIITQKTLVVDIGGGSTETIIGQNGDVNLVYSVKLGAIRMTKKFFPDDIVTKQQIKECREYIKGEWAPSLNNIEKMGFDTVVGTAGTIQNIAMMALINRKEPIPEIINGLTANSKDVLSVINKIIKAETLKERATIPGIDSERADIILGGALILEFLIKRLNIQKIFISSFGLREGIVFDTVQKNQAINEFRNLTHLRYQTIYSLCNHFQVDMEHAEHVKSISLQLFDDLQSSHLLGNTERELLETAALLHDVGYHISHDFHHKHSYYIIINCVMPGFTNYESELIANIARYHRKSHPKKKHENFEKLSEKDKRVVKILSGILRIAEGIDRGHCIVVSDVKAIAIANVINIYLYSNTPNMQADIELWGAKRRKDLLEEALNKTICFHLGKTNFSDIDE